VADAEQRPVRNKRKAAERSSKAEERAKLVVREITQRGLSLERYEFVADEFHRHKRPWLLRQTLDEYQRHRELQELVQRRDQAFQTPVAQTVQLATLLARERGIELSSRSEAAYLSLSLAPVEFGDGRLGRTETRRSAPRALAATWLMDQVQKIYETDLFDCDDEYKMTLRFGMLVEERADEADDLDVGRETDLWLLAAHQYLHDDMATNVKVDVRSFSS
jgi:hypothetical protein